MRVAVIGYITPSTKATQPPERTKGLRFGEGELALHDVLAEVRAARPGSHDSPRPCRRRHATPWYAMAKSSGSRNNSVAAAWTSCSAVTPTGRWTPASPGCRWWPRKAAGPLAVLDLVRTSAGGRAFRVAAGIRRARAARRPRVAAGGRDREALALDRQSGAPCRRPGQAAAHATGAAACAWARSSPKRDATSFGPISDWCATRRFARTFRPVLRPMPGSRRWSRPPPISCGSRSPAASSRSMLEQAIGGADGPDGALCRGVGALRSKGAAGPPHQEHRAPGRPQGSPPGAVHPRHGRLHGGGRGRIGGAP